MPAQKRPLPSDNNNNDEDNNNNNNSNSSPQPQQEQELDAEQPTPASPNQQRELPQDRDDSDGEGDSDSGGDKDEFILVKLADIRKEVQCPICLGIIRKTRTVMECLHRFCRECIDKSMRLGNNECPACRTHCASRRSLRDDPNYDALIAALYPDIDKYEEEDLAFRDEEKNRNKEIQASIAEIFRKQTEALGRRKSSAKATAVAFVRKSQGNYRNSQGQNSYLRGRGRSRDTSLAGSEDEDEEDVNGNDTKDSSSADDPSPERRQKRCRRWAVPRASPARAAANTDVGCEENNELEVSKENHRGTSPLRASNREMLAWGKGGVRSQTRHGNPGGSNGRFIKAGRMTKLMDYLRNLDETDHEFDVHLTLLPLDERSVPTLERSYLCCRPTLSIAHLCQFIALQTSVQSEEIEIFVRRLPQRGNMEMKPSTPEIKIESIPMKELQLLGAQECLAGLRNSFTSTRGDLVLVYGLKMQQS